VGQNGPVLCAEGVNDHFHYANDPILDTTPSPQRRFNGPSPLSGLRPHPGRKQSTSGGYVECGGGS
jgi:hypothetical protein